jgi:DNA-binding transcriptional LysR family regulator
LELRHIRYFLAIARERSFTKAASRLHIGQPPLSVQIKALESEMQVRLFHRHPHGIELTEAGEAFLAVIATLPEQVERGIQAARKAQAGMSGTFRLGFTGTTALNPLVPACIRRFRDLYPDVELHVMEANSLSLAEALREDRLDAAIVRGSNKPDVASVLSEEVIDNETLLAALPATHPMAAFERIDLAQLRDDPFILTPRNQGVSLHDAVLDACRQAGFVARLGPPAPQIASIVSLVSAGLGVSLVPHSVSQIAMRGVVLRPLSGSNYRVPISLAYRRDEFSPVVANFRSLIHDVEHGHPRQLE